MKLTFANYYTNKNKYLTNSKISCFLHDKPIFKKRYIDGDMPELETNSLIVGKAVDTWIVHGKSVFLRKYEKAVLKKDDPDKFERQKISVKKILSPALYDKIVAMSENLMETTVMQDIKLNYQKNKIFQADIKMGRWLGLAGIPDFFQINGNAAAIVDLKTTNVIGERFTRHAEEYGYYRQMAMYSYLIGLKYKKVQDFDYYIIAVENVEPYRVQLYVMDPYVIANVREDLFNNIIPKIISEKNFKKPDVDWDNYIEI